MEVYSSRDRVYIAWYEHNSTSNEPVFRISTDDEKTFGPTLKLFFNSPINNSDTQKTAIIFIWNL